MELLDMVRNYQGRKIGMTGNIVSMTGEEGRWRAMGAKILRFAVFAAIAFLVIAYLAPKAY